MAFYKLGQTQCAICGRSVDRPEDVVHGYSFLPPSDPLARFSSSLMHRSCFESWDQHLAFIAKFNAAFGPRQQMNEQGFVHTRPWWKFWGTAT